MAKKVKYEMYVSFDLGISGIPFRISKKEFERQLKYYTKEAEKLNKPLSEEIEELDEDDEYYIDVRKDTTEYEKYIDTSYYFHQNGGSIHLSELKCKDGYYWQ